MILFGIVAALVTLGCIAAAILTTIKVARDAYLALAGLAILSALVSWVVVRTHIQARIRPESVTAYLDAANALISNLRPTEQDANGVIALRAAALDPIPESTANEFETAYRQALADAVVDQEVTPEERRRLVILTRGLGLSGDTVRRANLNGFMQCFSALVADHKLTTEEEAKLTDLREALKVSDSAVQVQLGKADQLRRAREVGEVPLAPISTGTKLRKGEETYHTTAVREMKERVARTWVEDGERCTERELQEVRAGTLYVTNHRLLLVADGTTSIKVDAILNIAIDVQRDGEGVVKLTVDGRKTPYNFAFPEPYVTLAYIERVWAQA